MSHTPEQIALLKRWDTASTELAKFKALEAELRAEVVKTFSAPEIRKGTENFDLDAGFTLKIVKKQSYKLDGDKVNDVLDSIEKIGGPEGKLIADRLVKFKPELSITEYNQLPEKYSALVNSMVTISDASPTVEIVAPKAKRVLTK